MKTSLSFRILISSVLCSSCAFSNDGPNIIIMQPDDLKFFDTWTPPPKKPSKPNVVIPFPDWGLPNIERLREDGLQMMQAYTASPKCGTSRYSTITGKYPSRSATSREIAKDNGDDIAAVTVPTTKLADAKNGADPQDCSRENLAATFQRNGYRTAMIGKWHLSKINDATYTYDSAVATVKGCGFDTVAGLYIENLAANEDQFNNYSDGTFSHNMEWITYEAVKFINESDETTPPFFMYFNPTVPHGANSIKSALTDFTCQDTANGKLGFDPVIPGMTEGFESCDAYRDYVQSRAKSDDDLGPIWLDDGVGALLKALETKGLLENTIFLFQLDHGMETKSALYEGGIRIPQFIHYPKEFGPNTKFNGPVSTIDIAPTMYDFAGIDPEYNLDGKSWKDAIGNPKLETFFKDERCIFFEMNKDRATRCGCWKYLNILKDSPTYEKGEKNGYSNDLDNYFDLCGGTSEYITTPSSNQEAINLYPNPINEIHDIQKIAECHMERSSHENDDQTSWYQLCGPDVSPLCEDDPTWAWTNKKGVEKDCNWFGKKPSRCFLKPGALDACPVSCDICDKTAAAICGDVQMSKKICKKTSFCSWNWAASPKTCDAKVPTPAPTPVPTTPSPTPITDEFIQSVKEDILSLTTNNVPLKAKFLRLGFHDCVGGCNGCVDLEEPDNNGLEIPIAALEPIVAQYSGSLSRADIWALATIAAAESSQRREEALEYTFNYIGRVNCEDTGVDVCVNVPDGCDPSRNGPIVPLPSPNLNTVEVLHFFSNEFGFGPEETVALMGAHTIGEAVVENSGFDGQWVGNNERLNNQYYQAMIGEDGDIDDWFDAPGWNQETILNEDPDIPTRTQWRRGRDNPDGDIMLNTDIALVRDFSGQINTSDGSVSCQFRGNRNVCPAAQQTIEFMAKFKFSNEEFLVAFRDVLYKMVENGY